MKHCENCGKSFVVEYEYCPNCGAKTIEYSQRNTASYHEEQTHEQYSEMAYTEKPRHESHQMSKKKGKKGKIILVIVILAIIAGILTAIMLPRDLVIDSDGVIETYVGETIEIEASADGLDPSELKNISWTTEDSSLVNISNGELSATYDKNSFNAVKGEYDDEDSCTYTTYIDGEVKKGLKTWKGTAKVVVSLKPVEFKNGALIKEPADPKNSYIVITASEDYNTYFYLESNTKAANDLSFVVKKGEKATVYVPCDTYTFYYASGQTWYGSKILFGPQTFYEKDPEPWKFTSSTYWTLKFDAVDGNISPDDIDSSDFPE